MGKLVLTCGFKQWKVVRSGTLGTTHEMDGCLQKWAGIFCTNVKPTPLESDTRWYKNPLSTVSNAQSMYKLHPHNDLGHSHNFETTATMLEQQFDRGVGYLLFFSSCEPNSHQPIVWKQKAWQKKTWPNLFWGHQNSAQSSVGGTDWDKYKPLYIVATTGDGSIQVEPEWTTTVAPTA